MCCSRADGRARKSLVLNASSRSISGHASSLCVKSLEQELPGSPSLTKERSIIETSVGGHENSVSLSDIQDLDIQPFKVMEQSRDPVDACNSLDAGYLPAAESTEIGDAMCGSERTQGPSITKTKRVTRLKRTAFLDDTKTRTVSGKLAGGRQVLGLLEPQQLRLFLCRKRLLCRNA